MNTGTGPGDLNDAGQSVDALANGTASEQAAPNGKGERHKMTLKRRALKFLGLGPRQDGDHTDKNFRKGKFSSSAARARDAFFKHKKNNPKVQSLDEMTPIQRRMQSGSI
jgi:hypothetical protein